MTTDQQQRPLSAPSEAQSQTVDDVSEPTSHLNTAATGLPQRMEFVPDSLLAMAKDTRYVRDCQSMFLQILSSLLPRRRHSLLEQESWILASLLCLALGLRQTSKGTSLGMETVGLQFPTNASRWKLVVSTLATLSWAYAFSNNNTDTNSNIGRGVNGGTNANLLSEQQRQQNDELLRGVSRREFHERQRRAMLERANQAAASASSRSSTTDNNEQRESPPTQQSARENASNAMQQRRRKTIVEWAKSFKQRLKSILRILARVLASAALAPFEGPHTLPSDTNQQQQQQQNQPSNEAIQQAGRWLAKLQLAHFCWTGRYPTWVHRFSGHAFAPSSSTATSRLFHQPTTARLVGLLLGAQLVATVVQATSSGLSRWLVHREQQQSSSVESSLSLQGPSIPAVVFQSAANTADGNNNTTGGRRSVCSICKMERKYPAAPSSCGHVFCWSCLLQWVSRVRECPLCRAACRPQDIVALYNYTPNNNR